MAFRARLVAPPPEQPKQWPWHKLNSRSVPVAHMRIGDRRIDADTFLSSGFGIRCAIENLPSGWQRLRHMARFWTPPRIKTVEVAPEAGVPYLNTSQVFDVRPVARKFLAASKTHKAEERLVRQGTILVMASASVGRTTVATSAHENCYISHHFMRADPQDKKLAGWLYAFLQSPHGQAMLRGYQYASIIRHIEPHHVGEIPLPTVDSDTAAHFAKQFRKLIQLRNNAHRLRQEADEKFSAAIKLPRHIPPETGFRVRVTEMHSGRRRLEANYYHPHAMAIVQQFKSWQPLSELCDRIWWMPRFKRFYGEGGIRYLSADELFTTNPMQSKKILVSPADNHEAYFVKRGWIVMACSGQTYGLNGAAALMTPHHENIFFSHDLIRIVPDEKKIEPGYLLIALTNRTHGRPLLIRAAYGTSIPHLDPADVAEFPVVRLGKALESEIAALAVAAAKAHADAETMEGQMASEAGDIVSRFISGGTI